VNFNIVHASIVFPVILAILILYHVIKLNDYAFNLIVFSLLVCMSYGSFFSLCYIPFLERMNGQKIPVKSSSFSYVNLMHV
jgi:hypothetical protein